MSANNRLSMPVILPFDREIPSRLPRVFLSVSSPSPALWKKMPAALLAQIFERHLAGDETGDPDEYSLPVLPVYDRVASLFLCHKTHSAVASFDVRFPYSDVAELAPYAWSLFSMHGGPLNVTTLTDCPKTTSLFPRFDSKGVEAVKLRYVPDLFDLERVFTALVSLSIHVPASPGPAPPTLDLGNLPYFIESVSVDGVGVTVESSRLYPCVKSLAIGPRARYVPPTCLGNVAPNTPQRKPHLLLPCLKTVELLCEDTAVDFFSHALQHCTPHPLEHLTIAGVAGTGLTLNLAALPLTLQSLTITGIDISATGPAALESLTSLTMVDIEMVAPPAHQIQMTRGSGWAEADATDIITIKFPVLQQISVVRKESATLRAWIKAGLLYDHQLDSISVIYEGGEAVIHADRLPKSLRHLHLTGVTLNTGPTHTTLPGLYSIALNDVHIASGGGRLITPSLATMEGVSLSQRSTRLMAPETYANSMSVARLDSWPKSTSLLGPSMVSLSLNNVDMWKNGTSYQNLRDLTLDHVDLGQSDTIYRLPRLTQLNILTSPDEAHFYSPGAARLEAPVTDLHVTTEGGGDSRVAAGRLGRGLRRAVLDGCVLERGGGGCVVGCLELTTSTLDWCVFDDLEVQTILTVTCRTPWAHPTTLPSPRVLKVTGDLTSHGSDSLGQVIPFALLNPTVEEVHLGWVAVDVGPGPTYDGEPDVFPALTTVTLDRCRVLPAATWSVACIMPVLRTLTIHDNMGSTGWQIVPLALHNDTAVFTREGDGLTLTIAHARDTTSLVLDGRPRLNLATVTSMVTHIILDGVVVNVNAEDADVFLEGVRVLRARGCYATWDAWGEACPFSGEWLEVLDIQDDMSNFSAILSDGMDDPDAFPNLACLTVTATPRSAAIDLPSICIPESVEYLKLGHVTLGMTEDVELPALEVLVMDQCTVGPGRGALVCETLEEVYTVDADRAGPHPGAARALLRSDAPLVAPLDSLTVLAARAPGGRCDLAALPRDVRYLVLDGLAMECDADDDDELHFPDLVFAMGVGLDVSQLNTSIIGPEGAIVAGFGV